MNKPKAIILTSGGLDSATCLAIAANAGYACYALSFDYGQKHAAELEAAKRLAKQFTVEEHQIISLHLEKISHSALTNSSIEISEYTGKPLIPNTYVPARNTVFLSIALGWAETLKAQDIFIGVSSIDYSGYPDCRPEFINAFQALANCATKMAIEEQTIRINTPLLYLSKAETIKKGILLGVDYSTTISCYRANEKGYACGTCDSCTLRKQGFIEAGVSDPTLYLENVMVK
ncbi:MAG: 7-cyano-7-deazaguanine synthase [Legionellaceae bacterium]